ncbi:PP2C family protein-serine/threonine phosphatase [Nocardioides sp. GCM10027113]|uniref:PP2C family protein-serine/threonine phosphatase n=1 Tax=unclassified Nocardioides TaxID=2615069 RepID=UPI0036132439
MSRAEFLLRASRTASAVQNPERTLESLVSLLQEEMVDVAQAVVRTGPWQLTAAAVNGHEPVTTSTRWVDDPVEAFERTMQRETVEDVVLPSSGARRREALAAFFPEDAVKDAVDAVRGEQLVVIPLVARGRSLGILVLGRRHGFGFSGSHSFLEDLAERIAVGLDATLVVAESRYVASVLRRSLAPVETPSLPGLEVATYYRVAHQSEDVGGDFFDVFGTGEDATALCGDVTGKGVEAAVAAKRIRNAVRTSSMVERAPGWVLGLVNRVLVNESEELSERLATAVCARLRRQGDRVHVEIANAGHPPALVVRADGSVEAFENSGLALALLDGSEYAESQVALEPRDTLLLYTDGVTEARGAEELFGDARLRRVLHDVAGLAPKAMVEAIAVAVHDHLGDRRHDDIAVVAVQNRPDVP